MRAADLAVILMVCDCAIRNPFDTRPEPKPTPLPVSNDAIDPNTVSWTGKAFTAAKVTATLTGAWMDANSLILNNPAPSNWPHKDVSGVDCQGIVCLFYEIPAVIKGGKFDWLRPGQKLKGLENIHNGYEGHEPPAPDARCFTCTVSVDGTQRSNIVEVERR